MSITNCNLVKIAILNHKKKYDQELLWPRFIQIENVCVMLTSEHRRISVWVTIVRVLRRCRLQVLQPNPVVGASAVVRLEVGRLQRQVRIRVPVVGRVRWRVVQRRRQDVSLWRQEVSCCACSEQTFSSAKPSIGQPSAWLDPPSWPNHSLFAVDCNQYGSAPREKRKGIRSGFYGPVL